MIQAKTQPILTTLLLASVLAVTGATGASFAQSAPGNLSNTAGVNPHAISLYNLGLNAYRQGSPESAIIFFKRAVDLDPDLADAQYNLGVLYQSERRLKEAVPRFKEALRVRPDDADSHYQLALALIDLNQLADAKQQLMTIAPNNSHFGDAQKRVALIDGQLSNPGSSNISSDTQANTQNQSIAVATNVATATSAASVQPMSISKTSTETVVSTPSGVNNISSATATVTTVPSTASNPIALIDNASVQVVANGFSAPSGLTFDRQGNLYIANFVTNTIDRLAPDGKKTQFSTGVNLKGPIGLISDDDSNIYVANYLSGTVTKINPAGIAQVIVSGLKKPYYLARDKEGNLFVSQQEDNTIVRITFSHNSVASDTVSQSTP